MKMSKATAEHYVWGTACDGWRLADDAALSVIQERMPPHTSETRHLHEAARQFFFILSGEATMELNGELFVLAPEEGIEIPPDTPHTMMNRSDDEVEFLVISSPSTKGDRIAFE
jgi:mannose-6-phosphate isomerase-like protein (cupin superfamily)